MNIVTSELLSSKISYFLEEFHVSKILRSCKAYKVCGFSVKTVFQVAFENAFSSKSFFQKEKAALPAYLILASTDIKLSEEEIIQTYGKRWSIEAFFKMCKSFLKLGKENRSMSYDAMTAHVSIVFARYTMLSLEQRWNADNRSIGDLFFASYDES